MIAKNLGPSSWGGGHDFAISGTRNKREGLGSTHSSNVADYRETIASYLATWG